MTPIMPKFRTVCSLQSFKENEHAIMNPAYSLTLKKNHFKNCYFTECNILWITTVLTRFSDNLKNYFKTFSLFNENGKKIQGNFLIRDCWFGKTYFFKMFLILSSGGKCKAYQSEQYEDKINLALKTPERVLSFKWIHINIKWFWTTSPETPQSSCAKRQTEGGWWHCWQDAWTQLF